MDSLRQVRLPFRTDLVVIQPTPFCNLACKYCYLLDKDNAERMSLDTLSALIHDLLSSELIIRRTTLVWHAGEPLSIPIAYYLRAFDVIREIDSSNLLTHSIQTNGTTINDDWCRLFAKFDVDVGVSIDGPKTIHDTHRVDRAGRGSFDRAMRGLRLLQKHSVRHHVIAVLSKASLESPNQLWNFL